MIWQKKKKKEIELIKAGKKPLKAKSPTSIHQRKASAKLFRKARGLVSKKKIRYKEDGYDLDLTYVTPRIIAMGFPSEGKQGFFRNPMEEVNRFFEQYHKDHYKIYNLCSERKYSFDKFAGLCAEFPFDDHNPPPFHTFLHLCQDLHEYLSANDDNVAALHCKAGKGRTGTVIAAYFVYTQAICDPSDALTFFGQKRTANSKGVTIPSQRRYVHYFSQYVNNCFALNQKPCDIAFPIVKLTHMRMQPIPRVNGGCAPYLKVTGAYPYSQVLYNFSKSKGRNAINSFYGSSAKSITMPVMAVFQGDLKFQIIDIGRDKKEDRKLFHFWINTAFLPGKEKFRVVAKDGVTVRKSPDSTSEELKSQKLEYDTVLFGMVVDGKSDWVEHSLGYSMLSDKKNDFLVPLNKKHLHAGEIHQGMHLTLKKKAIDKARKDKYHQKFKKTFTFDLYFDVPTPEDMTEFRRDQEALELTRVKQFLITVSDTDEETDPGSDNGSDAGSPSHGRSGSYGINSTFDKNRDCGSVADLLSKNTLSTSNSVAASSTITRTSNSTSTTISSATTITTTIDNETVSGYL